MILHRFCSCKELEAYKRGELLKKHDRPLQGRSWRQLKPGILLLPREHPGKVAPEARETVSRYRSQCYDVLYEHFTGSMRRTIETNQAEIELLKQINSAISDEKEAKERRKKAERSLARLRDDSLNPQTVLFP